MQFEEKKERRDRIWRKSWDIRGAGKFGCLNSSNLSISISASVAGRCYKVCSRDVLELIEKPFEGEDEYGDDMGNKVMSVANAVNCIGCEACSRACTKKCHVHIEI